MDLKRISAAALALTMTASVSALAAGEKADLLIAPNPNAIPEKFTGVVTLDGEEITEVVYSYPVENSWEEIQKVVPVSDLPGAPAGYVSMRLLCQADPKGAAYWYEEDNEAMFYLNGIQIVTDFTDNSVYLQQNITERQLQEGVECYISQGVTYLPASFLASLDSIELDTYTVDGQEIFDFTLVVDPLLKLIDSIQGAVGMGMGEAIPSEGYEPFYELLGITPEQVERVAGYLGSMMSPDCIIVAQVTEGNAEAVKESFEAYRKLLEEQFTTYLSWNLEKIQNGKIVESGDYVMLFVGENPDTAVELFQAGIPTLGEDTPSIQPR